MRSFSNQSWHKKNSIETGLIYIYIFFLSVVCYRLPNKEKDKLLQRLKFREGESLSIALCGWIIRKTFKYTVTDGHIYLVVIRTYTAKQRQ